jgi:muconolactone delta-isomerase
VNREVQDSLDAEWRAQLRGRAEAVSRTLRQKWSNLRGRVGEMGVLGVFPGRVLRRFDLLPQRNARS